MNSDLIDRYALYQTNSASRKSTKPDFQIFFKCTTYERRTRCDVTSRHVTSGTSLQHPLSIWHHQMAPKFNGEMCDDAWLQQQAALMAAATAQGSYINPMAALATQLPHALNGMPNSVVPPTSGNCPFLYVRCNGSSSGFAFRAFCSFAVIREGRIAERCVRLIGVGYVAWEALLLQWLFRWKLYVEFLLNLNVTQFCLVLSIVDRAGSESWHIEWGACNWRDD